MNFYATLRNQKNDLAEYIMNELHRKYDGQPITGGVDGNFYKMRDTIEEAINDYISDSQTEDAEANDPILRDHYNQD